MYEGIALARTEGADFLLAIGGGSVIDTAKAIGMGVPYDGDFWDFFTGKAKIERTLPVGTVLTISAAGSEGSDSCVITQEDGNLKWGCPKTDLIRPKFSVLDPTYTCSLPDYQLACGAVDMLAHLCERYFTNTPDVALTDRLCEAVMKTIVDAAPKALADHSDYASHADLMWAGMLAHNNSCGIGRDQDWASHQIEHELSAFYDCAHGAGLAVVMPAWMEYVCGHDVMRFARFAVNVFGCEMDFAHPERTAQAGIRRLRDFFRTLGMPATLEEVGGRAEDIPAMVAASVRKAQRLPLRRLRQDSGGGYGSDPPPLCQLTTPPPILLGTAKLPQGTIPWGSFSTVYYFAYSTHFVSRMRLTLIWPGYSISSSIFLARSRARITI